MDFLTNTKPTSLMTRDKAKSLQADGLITWLLALGVQLDIREYGREATRHEEMLFRSAIGELKLPDNNTHITDVVPLESCGRVVTLHVWAATPYDGVLARTRVSKQTIDIAGVEICPPVALPFAPDQPRLWPRVRELIQIALSNDIEYQRLLELGHGRKQLDPLENAKAALRKAIAMLPAVSVDWLSVQETGYLLMSWQEWLSQIGKLEIR